jgi:hypothetical protein
LAIAAMLFDVSEGTFPASTAELGHRLSGFALHLFPVPVQQVLVLQTAEDRLFFRFPETSISGQRTPLSECQLSTSSYPGDAVQVATSV